MWLSATNGHHIALGEPLFIEQETGGSGGRSHRVAVCCTSARSAYRDAGRSFSIRAASSRSSSLEKMPRARRNMFLSSSSM